MASNKRIKGISIEIGGNTVGLEKALKDVNKKSNDLQTELKDVNRLLKFDPSNIELLGQKQKLLSDQVQNTTDRLKMLKDAEADVQKQFEKGEIGEKQYRNFRREIVDTETALKNLKSQASKIDDAVIDANKKAIKSTGKLKQAFKEAKDEAKEIGKSLATGIGAGGAGVAAGVGALVTGSQDYNEVLARLKTNASTSGRDLGVVEDAFMRILAVTGEADSAGETIANLLASGISDGQLTDSIDDITGAYIKFSDTLKTEGVADGLQETLATGKAVGPFAELLERSGIDVDKFNNTLGAMKTVGKDTDYVMQTLADLGLADTYDKYKELNPEVQSNAEAQAKLQKSLGDLAVILTPLVVSVTDFVTKLIEWTTKNPELTKTIVIIATVLGALVGVCMALAPIFTTLSFLAGVLGIGMLPLVGIIAGIIAAIALLIAAGVWLANNWDMVKTKAIEIFTAISDFFLNFFSKTIEVFKNALDWIDEKTNGKFKSVTDAIRKYLDMALKIAGTVIDYLKNTFKNGLDFLEALFTGDFEGMYKAVKNQLSNIKDTAKEIMGHVLDFFKGINLKDIGKNIIKGLINGVKSMASSLIRSVRGVVDGAIDAAKNLLGIHSPSRVFMEIGQYTGEGMAIGMKDSITSISRASKQMSEASVKGFNSPSNSNPSSTKNANNNQNILVEVPVHLDGREIARVQTPYINSFQGDQTKMRMRMKGVKP